VKEIEKCLPHSWRLTIVEQRLECVGGRRGNLRQFCDQFDKLDIGWLRDALLFKLQIESAAKTCERLVVDDETKVKLGINNPVYLFISDSNLDSSVGLSFRWSKNYPKLPFVNVMVTKNESDGDYACFDINSLDESAKTKITNADSLIVVDETNFTGHKFKHTLHPTAKKIALRFNKKWFVKFSHETNYASCNPDKAIDCDTFDSTLNGHHVPIPANQDNQILNVSPQEPMHLGGSEFGDRKEEAALIIKNIGLSLLPSRPLGAGGLGNTLLFDTCVPANTLPILISSGQVVWQGLKVPAWEPLIFRVSA
jgi:hypothetical protein